MHVAYVINTYPRPSHSFIRREVRALERRGMSVHRFAMRADPDALHDPDDILEHTRTEHILAAGKARLVASCLRAAMRRRFWPALRLALGCAAQASRGVPGTGGRLRHLIYLVEATHLAQRCDSLGITHLHAHFGTNATTVAMLAAEILGAPFSFTVHGPEEFDAPRALALPEKLARAAFAVAISSFGRSQLMRWSAPDGWPKLRVVHCGIEPEHFTAPQPLPATGRHLVAIGRLSEQKGHLALLQAFGQAQQTEPDLHLTIVGDGELRPAIMAQIDRLGLASHVTLTGWQDEAGVRAALGRAHALVLPSFAEGLPMVAMEAMAAARPVIATWVAGIPELVQDGTTGWLVPAGDISALATALERFARTSFDELSQMGQRGRKRVLERHDVNRSAALLERHFATAIPAASLSSRSHGYPG
jgi:glycosyltransferase involved in cell wall biosynthesis